MSKSPISLLQEYMVKSNQYVPTYDCIGHRNVGANDHEFTVRVKSGNLSAEGKGPTKKDAKSNAAKELLLQIGGAKPAEIGFNNNKIGSVTENSSMEVDGSPLSNSELSSNYIQLLHEHCARKSIPAPKFVEINSWGPSHLMNFTIKCQVSDIGEEATASTKKSAKSEAAKKVWFKVAKLRFDPSINRIIEEKYREVGIEIRDLKLEDILPDYSQEHQAAKEKYLNLTKLKPSAFISNKQTFENCHQLIASNYSLSQRESIVAQLSEITKEKNVKLLPICKSVLQKIANIAKVELEKSPIAVKNSIESYTVCYKLNTKPPIVSICTAKTANLAEFKAIVDIAKDFGILLI